jgi:hypothetical protein
MKTNLHKFNPVSVKWVDKGDSFQFIRKGSVGDNKNFFTPQHHAKFDEMLRRDFPKGIPPELQPLCK